MFKILALIEDLWKMTNEIIAVFNIWVSKKINKDIEKKIKDVSEKVDNGNIDELNKIWKDDL